MVFARYKQEYLIIVTNALRQRKIVNEAKWGIVPV